MNCSNCGKTLHDGKYICKASDYRVEDSNDDLVFIVETHEIASNDEEINSYTNVKYCTCGYWTV